MTLTDLIDRLTTLKTEHGDVCVVVDDGDAETAVGLVTTGVDADGGVVVVIDLTAW